MTTVELKVIVIMIVGMLSGIAGEALIPDDQEIQIDDDAPESRVIQFMRQHYKLDDRFYAMGEPIERMETWDIIDDDEEDGDADAEEEDDEGTDCGATLYPRVLVRWTGTDGTDGVGIEFYNVQVKEGKWGDWQDWTTNTTETEKFFYPHGSGAYYFRSRAIDKAGNVEEWPDRADAVYFLNPLIYDDIEDIEMPDHPVPNNPYPPITTLDE